MTAKQAHAAVRKLLKTEVNPRWLIEYERKQLLKNRREKIKNLNVICKI